RMKPPLIAKLQFWLGTINGFLSKYPIFKKALFGIVGLIVGKITKLITLLGKCKSTGATLAIVGLFIVWNVAYLIITLGLVASGFGAVSLGALAILEYVLEQKFQNMLEKVYCYLNISSLRREYYV
ncbi:hypothetical protein, partial [Sulfurimonas sp.]